MRRLLGITRHWTARSARTCALVVAAVAACAVETPVLGQPTGSTSPAASDGQASPTPQPEPPAGAAQGGSTQREGLPTQGPSDQPPPQVESPFLLRVYRIRPGKLWKGLLDALQAEGFSPEEVDDEGRIVKTSYVDFKQDDYQNQVADPPVQLSNDYHILQMIKVKEGKVSLEGRIAPGERGTELRLRARILVMGLDRVHRVRVLVDRRSTGVIESGFIHKLEARMGIEHL